MARYTRKRKARMTRRTKRAVLDVTTRKKRDSMMPYTNTTPANQAGGTGYVNMAAVITGGYAIDRPFIWCATARDRTTNGTNAGTTADIATRTTSSPYMVGLAEKIQIAVGDGTPWQWRRICFTAKDFYTLFPNTSGFNLYTESSAGYMRVLNKLPTDLMRDNLENYLFKGKKFTDWTNQMTAPTDNSRLTIKYDRTRTIASGNQSGMIRTYKCYHSMNKNLYYDEDESGGGQDANPFSAPGKGGMGDFYVVDYFQPVFTSTSSNQLSFSTQATLYWHEK